VWVVRAAAIPVIAHTVRFFSGNLCRNAQIWHNKDVSLSEPYNCLCQKLAIGTVSPKELGYRSMVADLPDQTVPSPQSLFCRNSGVRAARPVVSANVRERFARYFAADFAAAITEHCHDDDAPVVA